MEDFNVLLAYHYSKKDVKTLPESLTEDEKLDLIHLLKHHIIANGGGKMGGKEHDLFTIPLCRIHHDELHRNVGRFEQQYGSQLALLYKFLDRAIGVGALVIDD